MVFLTPGVPRWTPSTEGAIREAVEDSLLQESHFFDAKRELTLGKPSANKRLAADLAAFAVDGGSLLVGLAEDKENETFLPSPGRTAGMKERIESIAASLIDPPLYVQVTSIPSESRGEDGAALGYLLIEVPPSPGAPHQVEGVYWGRGDTQNIRLSDAEVARHHARRATALEQGDTLLDREIGRDPIPVGDREGGHLYLVAEPLSAAPEAAVGVLRRNNAADWLRDVTMSAGLRIFHGDDAAEPSLGVLSRVEPRSGGLAHTTNLLAGTGRRLSAEAAAWAHPESALLDIEFLNGGGIRVLVGQATRNAQSAETYVMDRLVAVYVRLLLHWVASFGGEIGYRGGWLLGVHVDGLAGATSVAFFTAFGTPDAPRFDATAYREFTSATTQEIVGQPWAVADRLIARLVWSLGTTYRVAHLLRPPTD